jgi:hypothetical protein
MDRPRSRIARLELFNLARVGVKESQRHGNQWSVGVLE